MSLPRLSTVSVKMPGSMASLGAPICFSRSLTMRSSSSRMFLRRPSIFFCTSTTGTSVTTPSAASSRSRIFFSRSSLVSVHERLHQEVLLGGKLPGLAAVLGGVLQDGVDRLHEALRLLEAGIALARVLLGSGRRGRRAGRCRAGGGLLARRRLGLGGGGERRDAHDQCDGRNRTADSKHGTRTSQCICRPACGCEFGHFRVWRRLSRGGSAVDPRVRRLDKIE